MASRKEGENEEAQERRRSERGTGRKSESRGEMQTILSEADAQRSGKLGKKE